MMLDWLHAPAARRRGAHDALANTRVSGCAMEHQQRSLLVELCAFLGQHALVDSKNADLKCTLRQNKTYTVPKRPWRSSRKKCASSNRTIPAQLSLGIPKCHPLEGGLGAIAVQICVRRDREARVAQGPRRGEIRHPPPSRGGAAQRTPEEGERGRLSRST